MSKIQKDPNGVAPEMNKLFAQWLTEHEDGTDSLARIARHVRDNHIPPTAPNFPVWRNYEPLKTLKPKRKKILLQPYRQGDPIPSLKHLFT